MRTNSKASRVFTGPFILATAGLSLFAINCGDDATSATGTAGTSTLPMSGAGGSASQGGSSAGMAGSATTAGATTTAGTGTAGTSTAAGSGGVGGGSAGTGAGGGSAGSGGGSSGSGGGGAGSSPLFQAVKTQMAKTCGTGKCHNAASGELNFQTTDNDALYKALTQPVPAGTKHCQGSTPVVANDANSLLLRAIKGDTTCMNNGASQNIAQMPDDCPDKGIACLTADEQKIFGDWVAAGAPK